MPFNSLTYTLRYCRAFTHSSPVFCNAKYRGGGRRPEGLVLQKTPILSFSPPLRRKLLFLLLLPPIAMRHKGEKRKIYPYITKENVSLTPSHPYPVALQGILTHSSPAVSRNIAGYCGNRYKNNPYYSHTEMAVSS